MWYTMLVQIYETISIWKHIALHHIKLLITHLIWIGIYTFSTNYIYLSVTNLTLVETFQKELLWKKWNNFKAKEKEMEVFEISFVVFTSPTVSFIENWLKMSNFCLRKRSSFDFLWLPEVSESATNKSVKFLILINGANLLEWFPFSF